MLMRSGKRQLKAVDQTLVAVRIHEGDMRFSLPPFVFDAATKSAA
jgi:hypothetical protein